MEIFDITKFGYIETEMPANGVIVGRITEVHRDQYIVMTQHGEVRAVIKGTFFRDAQVRSDFPCVGDFVHLLYNASGVSQISAVLPRHSKFSRANFTGKGAGYVKNVLEQVVCANFDYVFIVTSLNQDFNIQRVLRYLTQARRSGGQPVIILTKADLNPSFEELVKNMEQNAPNVPVHAVSSYSGYGLDALKEYLQPTKTIVFLGMSGVGKSSLLNALMEQDVMTVSDIRENDSRGRHTTTHRQLFMLPNGAMVIDTPGMRELGLLDADEGIAAEFEDIEDLFSQCKFRSCGHVKEPGCAVLAAINDGTLPKERWKRYLAQSRENKFVEDKRAYLAEHKAGGKSFAKWKKEAKRSGEIRR
ncbi:MAG: ribosome small subunit-dependent GTPase A [Defluviitaleaceae bacterium]|nr:ribosome small subunit-dependent GTPase A [Defluviitaleaceae bacterium]